MATVLIVGNERESQTELAASLEVGGHAVTFSDYREQSLSSWDKICSNVDVAIVDVTSLADEKTELLRQFCLRDPRHRNAPPVLCYSRVNRGPHFELAIERLGARFVYA
jgi:CheY-like chemotaxis protein